MTDNLVPQHKRMAMGESPEVPAIENPFKQVQYGEPSGKGKLNDSKRAMNRRGDLNHD